MISPRGAIKRIDTTTAPLHAVCSEGIHKRFKLHKNYIGSFFRRFGLHQGLNLRDSGLDVAYALREEVIKTKR